MDDQQKHADQARKVYSAYKTVFNSDEGKIVLEDLCKNNFMISSTIDKTPELTYRNEGKRELLLQIIATAEISNEKIKKITQYLLS